MAQKSAIQKLIVIVFVLMFLVGCTPTPTPTPIPILTLTPTLMPTRLLVFHPGWTSYTNANEVHDLVFDRAGNLWAVGSGGVVQWHPDGMYTKYTTADGLVDNGVSSVAVSPDGDLWFGTWDSGVSRFDGTSWKTYTTDDGLADNWVWSIAASPDGAL